MLWTPCGKERKSLLLLRNISPILLWLAPPAYMCFIEAHSYSTAVKSRRKSLCVCVYNIGVGSILLCQWE